MIVARDAPPLIVVAIAAFRAEARRVRVVGTVTAIAVLGDLLLVVAAAMAGGAIDLVVHAQQLEAGFLEVIVLGRLPLLSGMAFRAVGAARAAMLVVGRVTAGAALRGLLVAPAM